MGNLETTNLILAVMAVTSVVQLLLLIAGVVWAGRQFAKLKHELAALQSRTDGLVGDLRTIAGHASGVSRELEKVAVLLQEMVGNISAEVNRATSGVHVAMDVIEALYHGVTAVGDGLKAGLGDFFASRFRRTAAPQDAKPDDPSPR
jgi:hypothetical protein